MNPAATTRNVGGWLRDMGLTKYETVFEENQIDFELLVDLTDEDLKSLEISLGDRKRILKAIANLRGGIAEPFRPGAATRGATKLGKAERRQITIMFCDLVDSTKLANELDPEDLGHVMRTYLNCCSELIPRWGGYIAKFQGDGVLAYFGWPQAHEDDGERAVRAGLELSAAVGRMRVGEASTALAARVGIATGLVMVGELIGEGSAQEEAAVGAMPNLAARLQALAEPGAVVIAPATYELVSGLFEVSDLGVQRLKGFPDPVQVWGVHRARSATTRFEARVAQRLTPLVGRKHEIRLLGELWERAQRGNGQAALVVGEAGVGKSRLVEAFRKGLREGAHESLHWQCSNFYANSALHPFIEEFNHAAFIASNDAAELKLQKIERLLATRGLDIGGAAPVLATLLSIPYAHRYPPLNLSLQRLREKMIELIARLIVSMTPEVALLMIVEDVHWADPTTVLALKQLVASVEHERVLVIITCRPGFESDWTDQLRVIKINMRRLARSSAQIVVNQITGENALPGKVVIKIDLRPLSRFLTHVMVNRMAGKKALPGKILESIVSTADGIPLFVEELTRTVLESGQLRETGDRYELRGPVLGLLIPSTLRDALAARLDRLTTGKDVAQVAATIGRTFSSELLGHVIQKSDIELRDALSHLCEAEILEHRGSAAARRYVFKHALIQEVAYRSQLNARRREVHGQVAHALETHFPDEAETVPEALAHHFAEAGLNETAAGYSLAAGRRALQVTATSEAIAHLSKGLELIRSLAGSDSRDLLALRLHALLGTALMLAKGWAAPEAEEAYGAANSLSHSAKDPAEAIWILWGIWVYHLVRGDLEQAIAATDRIRAVADQHGDPDSHLIADMVSLQAAFYSGRFQEAETYCRAMESEFSAARHRSLVNPYTIDLQLVSLVHRSIAIWILGRPDEAAALADQAQRLARSLEHRHSIAWALTWGSMALLLCGECDVIAPRLQEGIAIANDQGFSYVAAMGTMMSGWVDGQTGAVSEGIGKIKSGLVAFQATGAAIVVPHFRTLLAELLGKAGRASEALEVLREATDQIERWSERWSEAEVYRVRGDILASDPNSDPNAVEQSYRHAIAIAVSQNAKGWQLRGSSGLARFLSRQGRREEAREILERLQNTSGADA